MECIVFQSGIENLSVCRVKILLRPMVRGFAFQNFNSFYCLQLRKNVKFYHRSQPDCFFLNIGRHLAISQGVS